MARPLDRNQQLENRAFLRALRKTGNVRLAAREVGVAYGTIQHRRKAHPVFATRVDAALASAAARLNQLGPYRPKAGAVTRVNRVTSDGLAAQPAGRPPAVSQPATLPACGSAGAFRTAGGEPVVIRLKDGRIQVRAAQPGKLTRACEQAFLSALSATANIRLSAAAAGASEAAFHRRRRQHPGFAREMRWAVQEGYRRLNEALLAGFLPDSHEDDAWRHNDAPEMPRMTAAQALQLMYLHQKEAVLPWGAALHRRRGKGLEEALRQAQAGAQYNAMVRRRAEDGVRDGMARLAARLGVSPHEEPPVLPDLSQVAASKADPAKGGHSDRALFGGWRLEQLTPEQRALGAARLDQARLDRSGGGKA